MKMTERQTNKQTKRQTKKDEEKNKDKQINEQTDSFPLSAPNFHHMDLGTDLLRNKQSKKIHFSLFFAINVGHYSIYHHQFH
jgi:hypothetical protein